MPGATVSGGCARRFRPGNGRWIRGWSLALAVIVATAGVGAQQATPGGAVHQMQAGAKKDMSDSELDAATDVGQDGKGAVEPLVAPDAGAGSHPPARAPPQGPGAGAQAQPGTPAAAAGGAANEDHAAGKLQEVLEPGKAHESAPGAASAGLESLERTKTRADDAVAMLAFSKASEERLKLAEKLEEEDLAALAASLPAAKASEVGQDPKPAVGEPALAKDAEYFKKEARE
ncbi:hypothetical protein T484DRAFT_1820088, partial [Baffinella frigidus]